MNLKTGVIEVLPAEQAFYGFGVSNDGTVVGSTVGMVAERHSYLWRPAETSAVELSSVLNDGKFASIQDVTIGYLAPDNSYACGFASDAD